MKQIDANRNRNRKQNVYVPEYPGCDTFEQYHYIPSFEYLQKTKEALENFVRKANRIYSIQTTRGNQNHIENVRVKVCDNYIKIDADGSKYRIKPSKWGTDEYGDENRFWLFDSTTLDEINLTQTYRNY